MPSRVFALCLALLQQAYAGPPRLERIDCLGGDCDAGPLDIMLQVQKGNGSVQGCSDVATGNMKKKGLVCENFPWAVQKCKRCANNAHWRRKQFCAASCAKAGCGYEGLTCLPTSRPADGSCRADISDTASCEMWKAKGYCPSHHHYYEYMMKNCHTTCACEKKHTKYCADDQDKTCGAYDCGDETYEQYYRTYCTSTCRVDGCKLRYIEGTGDKCMPLSVSASKDEALNIIFLPSGFGGDMDEWERIARQTSDYMYGFKPLNAPKIKALNVWYIREELADDNGQHCWYNCGNIRRCICCDAARYKALVRKHCGSGFHMDLQALHNNKEVGGCAGEVAATNVGGQEGITIAHEIAHSLFGLADEYSGSSGEGGDDSSPNCDSSPGCPKWKDLINVMGATRGVGCHASNCKGAKFYNSRGGENIMKELGYQGSGNERDYGAVAERITCCKFRWQSGDIPEFCKVFNRNGLDLDAYCFEATWGRKRPPANLLQLGTMERLKHSVEVTQGVKYVFREDSVEWVVSRDDVNEGWVCNQNTLPMSGIFAYEELEGDDGSHAEIDGVTPMFQNNSSSIYIDAVHSEGNPDEQVRATRRYSLMIRVEAPPRPGVKAGVGFAERTRIGVLLNKGETCRIKKIVRHTELP